jgi:AcrR family transcriptional regulator
MARMSAAERRSNVVGAALGVFACSGYDATSVSTIAELTGVSQPYLFKLFASKRDLFLAAADHCFTLLRGLLADAADGLTGQAAVDAMTRACFAIQAGDALLGFPVMLYAAVHDPVIAEAARMHFTRLHEDIVNAAGVDDACTGRMFATLLLLQTVSVMEPCAPSVRRAVLAIASVPQRAPAPLV